MHPDHDPDVGDVQLVPWTAVLALRVAGVQPFTPRATAVELLRDAIDEGRLPEVAVDLLIEAGWHELRD